MDMNIIQIVFSPTGGTQKAADMITSAWDIPVRKVDLSDLETDFSAVSLEKDDIAIIAVPSFGGRVPAPAIERLEEIKGNQAMGVLVCVYGNRAYEDTLIELNDSAEKSGFRVVAGIAAIAEHFIAHQYAAGRPDSADAEVLHGFAEKIIEKINENPEALPAPQIPGNRPYKKAGSGLIPKADRSCTGCGLCAQNCPVQREKKTSCLYRKKYYIQKNPTVQLYAVCRIFLYSLFSTQTNHSDCLDPDYLIDFPSS